MPSRLRHVLLLLPLGLTACFGPLLDDYNHEQDWDQDGVKVDADCDDEDPQVTQATYWPDGDRDGYGADGVVVYGCAAPDGYADNHDDCDDTDVLSWREAAWFEDLDGDGYGVGESEIRCAGYGTSEVNGDCDDSRGDVYPGAEPVCGNGVDDDCDGLGDCGGPSEDDDGEPWDGKYSGSEMSEMGASVAGAGDVNGDGFADLLIGTPGVEDSEGDEIGGAALIYGPAPSSYALGEALSGVARLTGTVAGGRAGEVVSSAGDLNGDGYADLLIGAPEAGASSGGGGWGGGGGLPMAFGPGGSGGVPGDLGDGIFDDEGAGYVYVVLGPVVADEVVLGDDIGSGKLTGSGGGGRAGDALAALGDRTGDGFGDFLVGAPLASPNDTGEAGTVSLLAGPITSDGSIEANALLILEGTDEGARVGESVAALGDLDGDGLADFAVGAPTDAWQTSDFGVNSPDSIGAVYVYTDPTEGPESASGGAQHVLRGAPNAAFGAMVSAAGDVDGDGVPDLLVGAPFASVSAEHAGSMFLYSGGLVASSEVGADVPESALLAQLDGAEADQELGVALTGPGDLDGDGHADVIVGVPTYGSARGVVALYYGPLSGSLTLEGADLQVEGSVSGGRLGVAVAGAGDVNGLGRPDVVAGSLKLPDEDVGDRGYGYLLLSDGL